MANIFTIIQVACAVLLIGLILLQNRGGGLSSVFGGSEIANIYRTKRGVERGIFILTIIFSILFLSSSLVNILVRA